MKTDITLILDRSGSMQSIAADTIGGINTFLADQKATSGEAVFTLVQFDNVYEVVHDAVPIKRVEPLTNQTFVPRGATALLDAIGKTVDTTGTRLRQLSTANRPDKVICVIVTDGQENASQNYTRAQIFDKISHQTNKYNWEFVFLGANQDAIAEAHKIGISPSYALNFTANSAGTANTYSILSANTTRSRSGGELKFDEEDRKKAYQPDKK